MCKEQWNRARPEHEVHAMEDCSLGGSALHRAVLGICTNLDVELEAESDRQQVVLRQEIVRKEETPEVPQG